LNPVLPNSPATRLMESGADRAALRISNCRFS